MIELFGDAATRDTIQTQIINEKVFVYSLLILYYFATVDQHQAQIKRICELLHSNTTNLISILLLVLSKYQILDPQLDQL